MQIDIKMWKGNVNFDFQLDLSTYICIAKYLILFQVQLNTYQVPKFEVIV